MSCAASKVVSDCGQLKPEVCILPLKKVDHPRSCQLWEPLIDRRQSGSISVNPVYWAPSSSLVITSAHYVISCALCCLDQDQFDTSMGSSYSWNFVSSRHIIFHRLLLISSRDVFEVLIALIDGNSATERRYFGQLKSLSTLRMKLVSLLYNIPCSSSQPSRVLPHLMWTDLRKALY